MSFSTLEQYSKLKIEHFHTFPIQNNKEKINKTCKKNTQTRNILFKFKHIIIIEYDFCFIPLTTIISYNYKNIKTAAKL